ncbi:MAG: SRPBCC family protein [Chthonomonadaceae bacterium]|nr:SRPBCC family protein [Chthonomonadaceae bacterium]
MPNVQTTVWIDSPIQTVFNVAKRNEDFPSFMKDVQSVTVVERDGARVVSDWVGTVSAFGLKIKWTQEDSWDDDAFLCRFRMLKGDYDKLEGTWTFSEVDNGTKFESVVDYEYRVPGLGPLVYKVIHGLVVKNLDDTLAAIKARAESLK